MRTLSISLIFIFIGFYSAVAQDIITLKTGDQLNVKIVRLNPKDVTFSPKGTTDTLSILRDEIAMLQYQNGTVIRLAESRGPAPTFVTLNDSMYYAGVSDARVYYKGYKGAATGTLISAVAFPYNLIPALICSSVKPKDENLGFRDQKLMQNPDYNNGYRYEANKIKQKKVWKNYAIGSGVIVAFYVILTTVIISSVVMY